MRISLILIALAVLLIAGAEARYSPGLEIAENENITLDGGFIYNLQGSGVWNPSAYGAIPGDGIDDSDQIQAAINASAAAGGGIVFCYGGQYDLATSQSSDNSSLLVAANNVTLLGVPGKTVFRIADDYRTPYRGAGFFMDLEDNFIHDFNIYGVTFDGNGQNNLIDSDAYRWDDKISRGGIQLTCGNCTFENCKFVNQSSFNVINLQGYGDTGYAHDIEQALGNKIKDCNFENVGNSITGNDLYDHSTIYIATAYTTITGCTFTGSDAAMAANMAAIELHSEFDEATNNVIYRYRYGIYGSSDACFSGESEGVVISENYIYACLKGINIWGTAGRFKDIHITGNKVVIDPMGGTAQRFGIQHGADWTVAAQFPTDILDVQDNYIEFVNTSETTSECYGMYFKYYNNTFVTGNTVYNSTYSGILLYELTTDVGSGVASIAGNNIIRYGTSTASSTQKGISVTVDKASGLYDVSHNTMSVKLGKPVNNCYGVFVGGSGSRNFTIRYNDVRNTLYEVDVTTNLDAYSNVVAEFHRSAAPTNLRYSQGSIIWDTDPVGGAAPGWVVNATGYPKAMASLGS